MYLTPYYGSRKICHVKYKQPYQGGQVIKKKKMLNAFPKVKYFPLSKLVCTVILKRLRHDHGIVVAMDAIERELEFSAVSSHDRKGTNYVDHYITNHCHFTLVTHGVHFHVDHGKGSNTSFLENRVVFIADRNEEELNIPEGRGYCGHDKFMYALIDW